MPDPGTAITAAEILDCIENGNLSELEDFLSDDEEEQEDTTLPQTTNPIPRVGADTAVRQEDDNMGEEGEQDDDPDAIDQDNTTLFDFVTDKKKRKWLQSDFITPDVEWEEAEPQDIELLDPLDYVKRYLPPPFFELVAKYTNMYALQTDARNFKPTNSSEIESLFGLHIALGTLKFPRVRLCWDSALGITLFLETMSRDRFFQLRNNLHLLDNLAIDKNNKDRFVKVRPIYECILNRCKELSVERDTCIDEQMVPFRGKLNVKQYMKGKPTPWGIKIFVLCGKSGQAYDFVLYQGSTTEINQEQLKNLGFGAAIVLHLVKRLEDKGGHFLFYDNYFSSYGLLQILKKKLIFAAGTIRLCRFSNPPLKNLKELKKEKRGFHEEVQSADRDIVLVRWLDNRPVSLASNFVGAGVVDEVKRWDHINKRYIQVSRPEVVRRYNHAMGGVDLLDQLIGLYRIYIRSKKWTLRLIFHAVDFAVSNSWIEYKKDYQALGLAKNKMLDLMHFRMRVAESLVKVGKSVKIKKRGRPSQDAEEEEEKNIRKRPHDEHRPIPEVRTDLTDHMAFLDSEKEGKRCKYGKCGRKTHFYCDKCNVHLCIKQERNCMASFHRNK